MWKLSTPTVETAPINQALVREAQVVFDYIVICPLCNNLELMSLDNIKAGGIKDYRKILCSCHLFK